jgi:hypothetical protein
MRRFTAVALAALLLLSTMGAGIVAAATTINYDASPAQSARVHEDVVTIEEHDRTDMTGALAYYDDAGEVTTLPADINSSETAPVQVHPGEINESQYRAFPRINREDGNNITWTNTGNWTTASSGSGDMTLTKTTPAGDVQAVEFDITASGSEWGEANYSKVDITSDAAKRVPLVGLNVDTLATDAVVDIRFVDADDDYVALEVNETDANATGSDEIIANSTGEAYITQERLSELDVEGSGDGSLDEIQKIWVRGDGGNAVIEVFALDAESKSASDIARAYHDHDDDGDLEWETIQDKNYAGYVNMTGLSDLGPMYDTAVVYDKRVRNIFYDVSYLTGDDERVLSSNAEDFPNFDQLVNASYRLEVPAPIDVSHGTLTLEAEQSLVGDRYVVAEYATDVGDTDFENITYTSARSSFTDGKKGDVVVLANNVNAGEEHAIHFELLYTQSEFDALTSGVAAGGPVGSGGGLFGGFFNTVWGWVIGIGGSVLGFLGLRRLFGGG